MTLINILFFLTIISMTAMGNSQQDLIVSSMHINRHRQSSRLYNLNIYFRGRTDNIVSGTEIEMKVLDKTNRTLERKIVVFDESDGSNLNYTGQYFGISEWFKLGDESEIHVIGYVHSKADGNSFQIDQKKGFNINQILLFRKLSLAKRVKMDFTLTSVDGQNGFPLVHTTAMLTCKVYSTGKGYRPTFHSNSTLLIQKETYNEMENKIEVIFRAQTSDHLSRVWCSMNEVNNSITIKVLHAPTGTIISPQLYKTLKAGSKLNCSSNDGYPQPIVSWKLISGPQDATDYYELQNDKRLFFLKKTAPVDSRWQVKCESSNKYGKKFSVINFTVAQNCQGLMEDYAAKMDEDRLLWQRSLMENISSRIDQIEKAMRNERLETRRTMAVMTMNLNETIRTMGLLAMNFTKDMNKMKTAEQRISDALQKIVRTNEEMEKKMKENGENVAKKLQEMSNAIEMNQIEQTKKIQQIQDGMNETQKLLQEIKMMQDTMRMGEFVWRVARMADKRKQAAAGINEEVYSEYFYTHPNGYRMKLRMDPNGNGVGKGTHVSLFFRICKGPFDDMLLWPMYKKIRLAIVNQKTGQEFIGYDLSYQMDKDKYAHVYEKPTKENIALGHQKFISWDELQRNSDAFNNDVLFFRCSFAN